MRQARCILHIGTEKTGTKTLQTYLAQNREKLLAKGFLVPSCLDAENAVNHQYLAAYALDGAAGTSNRQAADDLRGNVDETRYREQVEDALAEEVHRVSGGGRAVTLVFSNEHCHSRLTEVAEIACLRRLLELFAERAAVVVYLRPQHELALSLYDTALKAGFVDIDIPPSFATDKPRWVYPEYFDYAALLARWASVFGQKNIKVRLCDRREFQGGSLVDDFMALLDCGQDGLVRSGDHNVSLDAACQAVLNAVNRLAWRSPDLVPLALRIRIVDQLRMISNGPPIRPRRSEVVRFYESFAEGNEEVRRQYFPERRRLFCPDFSGFPDNETPPPNESALLTQVLVRLLTQN